MNQAFGFLQGVSYDAAGGPLTYTSSTTFTVPNYSTSLVVVVRGAGGGGGGGGINSNFTAGTGGASTFKATDAGYGSDIVANGGAGGQGENAGRAGGAGGTASGGSTNTTGGTGSNGQGNKGGEGGAGAGSGGGSGGSETNCGDSGVTGSAPGGGGSGGAACGPGGGGGGGGGAYATRTFANGDLTPGSVVTITVGSGGSRGQGFRDGGLGARGEIVITWS